MEGYCLSMQNTLHCLFVFPLCHIHTSGGSFLTISIPRRCIALVLSFAFSRFSFILWLPHSLNTFTLAFIIWKTFCLFLHCGSQISPILTQLSNAVILKPKWRWVLKKKNNYDSFLNCKAKAVPGALLIFTISAAYLLRTMLYLSTSYSLVILAKYKTPVAKHPHVCFNPSIFISLVCKEKISL